jgi:hypothetical protein
VPIELSGLACNNCGGKKFQFTISSLKPNRAKDPTDWDFDLEIACTSCQRRKLLERILNFFRVKRIKVGPTGFDLEMFPIRKS